MFKVGLKGKNPCSWNQRDLYFSRSGGTVGIDAIEAAARLPVRGVKAGGKTLSVVVIWSSTIFEEGSADLVLVYHGGGATSFGKTNTSLKFPDLPPLEGSDGTRVSDVHVNQIPQQVAASGRPVVVMIPQGPDRESFNFGAATNLWSELRANYLVDVEWGDFYVAGHSAGGPIAARIAQDPDAMGLLLFDPVIQNNLKYVRKLADQRVDNDFQLYAAFNTATTGQYDRYKAAGESLQGHADGRYTVVLREEACGPHAHHSMMSGGSEAQDRQIGETAGYTRLYEPGSGNFERALRHVIGDSNLVA